MQSEALSDFYCWFQSMVCEPITTSVSTVLSCHIIDVSCGSIVAKGNVSVQVNPNNPDDPAPKSIEQFTSQLQGVKNSATISKFKNFLFRTYINILIAAVSTLFIVLY